MKNDAFKWGFIGIITLAVIFIFLAIVGVISTWIIAVAVNGALLYYLGKEYTGCYREKISRNIRMEVECQ